MPAIPEEHEKFRRPGFLDPAHRAWLEGEKDVSQSYRNKMKHDIRERVTGTMNDFYLLDQSEKVDDELREKIVRNHIPHEIEETIHPDSDIQADRVSSAFGMAEFVGEMFAGKQLDGTSDRLSDSTKEIIKLVEGDNLDSLSLEEFLVMVLDILSETTGADNQIEKEDLKQLVEELEKEKIIDAVEEHW